MICKKFKLMHNSSLNWIQTYRNQPQILQDDLLQFIFNHDVWYTNDPRFKSERRNYKIDKLMGSNIKDPLEYLNPFIDILQDHFKNVMSGPMNVFEFHDKSNNHTVSKSVYAQSHILNTPQDLEKLIKEYTDHIIYPYMIIHDRMIIKKNNHSTFDFRCGVVNLDHYLYSDK